MGNRIPLIVAAIAVSVLAANPMAAQSKPAPKGEIGLTYSFMRLGGRNAPAGVGIDASRAITRSANDVEILLVGDAGINRFGSTTDYDAATQVQVMGGLRFAGRTSGGASPFAQVLAGVASCCGETSPAVTVGVGVSAPVGKGATRLRVQADFPTVFYGAGTTDGVTYASYRNTGIRVNAGIAIPLKR